MSHFEVEFGSLEKLKRLIVVGTVLGFCLNVIATMKWPNEAYYLLAIRAWEMMMGGVAFLYPWILSESRKKVAELIGLTLILSSYAFVSSDISWPGHFALLPVLGTYLMIVSNQQSSIITNNAIFQCLGKWSYSIYLWHWPIVVLGYHFDFQRWFLYGLPLSLLLGWVSFFYIEKINFKSYLKWSDFFKVKPIILNFIVIMVSVLVIYNNGYRTELRPISFSEISKIEDYYSRYKFDPSGFFDKCNASFQIKNTGIAKIDQSCLADKKGGVFIWGDSHMAALSIGLRNYVDLDSFSQLTSSGCGPSFNIKRNGHNRLDVGCNFSNDLAIDLIFKSEPNVVIIGMRHKHEQNDWNKTIEKLKSLNIPNIIVIGPFPQWEPSLPSVYTKRHMGETFIHDKNFNYELLKSNDFLINTITEDNTVKFINMIDNLCINDGALSCRAKVGNELIVFDYGHLTTIGSDFIVKEFLLPYLP